MLDLLFTGMVYNLTFVVKWGDNISEPFTVRNGVRQGGVLSPHVFNLYIDELNQRLNKSSVGCNFKV